ncbi:glycoside hydrolase family 43 protein [Pseudarthrobacter sp. NS4]|uniref:glycoside hydrolase family 43 protein n=1 Tax=Pseudarthrobacter sp. NS4 TaxID=2973976 RepID=UPI002161DF2B|nr:glycoside hydrolase family 43 protein [Pseudarthrobacter sp. NS4]
MTTEPILPGFHPDPSICRLGDDYFLVNSSFEYFPGVPIFHSKNLLDWTQIGNVLDRETQLNVRPGITGAGGGIYAPTLRYHDGEFWLATTNITDIRRGHLIVRAKDPAGPWTEPVYTTGAVGVDPDLSWDGEGTCHLTWSHPMAGIFHATVDPATGELQSTPHELWKGTGLAHPEGPHLFQRNGWWYLLVAEGGTHHGHSVSIARSRTIEGPFQGHPQNPIFSHRSTPHAIQNTGHADLVERTDGTWAMVYLGVRPRGSFPKYHVNGRETFLAGVDWVEDWPVVRPEAFDPPRVETSFRDNFSTNELHPRWISPGVNPRSFTTRDGESGLILSEGRGVEETEAVKLLAVRARDPEWTAVATIPDGDAALVVRIDDQHWAGVERCGNHLKVRLVVGPLDQELAVQDGVFPESPLAIRSVGPEAGHRFRSGPDTLELGYLRNNQFCRLASVDGRYLSTEVAGGFTGRVIGVEALGSPAKISSFEYQGFPASEIRETSLETTAATP